MTNTLAAAAAEFEHPYDEDIDFDALVAEVETPDPMIARRMLLDIARAEADRDAVAILRERVLDPYNRKIADLERRIGDRRRALEAYVLRFGPVKFPDAGGAHLTTKSKGGKIRCSDVAALEDWIGSQGLPLPLKDAPVDVPAAIDMIAHELHVHAEPDGRLVSHETGEVVEIPGIVVEPETKTLAVRKP